jgi:antimicrobial peptide system SdpB family protein
MLMPLSSLGRKARHWAEAQTPWTNVYGVARSLLATGTAATLLFNDSTILFRPASGITQTINCANLSRAGVFCLLPAHLEVARWAAVLILLVVASGWRPRITGLLHWWVAYSLQTSALVLDGGDQVTAVLTLLLLPVTLTDSRRWHWTTPPPARVDAPLTLKSTLSRLCALSALLVIRIQVSGIYLHAAVSKMSINEWIDGTVLYYWFTDPLVGLPGWLSPLLLPVATSPVVAILTWSALLVELLLFMGLVMPKKAWSALLVAGIAFHGGIALMMGLISFGLAMTAALILYLRPWEREFRLHRLYGIRRVSSPILRQRAKSKESDAVPSSL